MSKLMAWMLAGAIALLPAHASAALGPHGQDCGGDRPAMLVKVIGLKHRDGTLRIQTYGGEPERFFDKGSYIERVDVRMPAMGPIEVCMPVKANGIYAVSVRHDANGNGSSDLSDGAGMSGNPNVSLMDVVFRRKPAARQVEVDVNGTTSVQVLMNYVHGTSVGPIAGAGMVKN
ncbi:DUF2141 domain-containing protein [Sphingomonas nostoxanthinifaciens]|uniref:DUF2141 domain-containing protein n=1 Tax=Sphingomonas nostoxanthinifaciens TaxID=2872652 RepID=UPI001CC211FE|nr:DUF2141 domain-containing protein [Sphingomonas nostoxanthinifaciens]